jgi:AraC-like DNA-binding protein
MGIYLGSVPEFAGEAERAAFWSGLDGDTVVVAGGAAHPVVPERVSLRAVFGGRVAHRVGDARLTVDDDSFLVLNPHSPLSLGATDSPGARYCAIYFSPATLRHALGRADSAHRGDTVGFIERLRPYEPGVASLVRAFADAGAAASAIGRDAWERRAEDLLCALLAARRRESEHILSLGHARERTRHEIYRRVAESTDYLLSHYDEPLQLKQLADVACLAKFHYLRMFVAVHGITPMEYLRCKRVAVASRLLLAESAPLGTIARRVGIADRSTLLRLFIDYRGTTPDQYRRDLQGHGAESVPDSLLADLVRARQQSKLQPRPSHPVAVDVPAEAGYRRVATPR